MLPAVESWRPGHWTTEKSQESTSRNSSVPVRTTWLGVSRERGIISRTTSVGEGTPSSCQHVLCPGILPPRGEAWLSWEKPAVLTPQWRVKCSGRFTYLGADDHSTPGPLGPPPPGAEPLHPSFSARLQGQLGTSAPRSPRPQSSMEYSQGWGGPAPCSAFSLGLSQGAQSPTGRLGGWGLRAGLLRLQEERGPRLHWVVQLH